MQMMQRLGGHILPVSGRLAQLDTLCRTAHRWQLSNDVEVIVCLKTFDI